MIRPILMRLILVCGALAVTTQGKLSAQGVPAGEAQAPSSCGRATSVLAVKTDKTHHPVAHPEPGKSLVYFLQDDSLFASLPRPTTRFAINGAWIGATHANSYFYVSVTPGEQHLCAQWAESTGTPREAMLHFTAQPGGTYYFRAEDVVIRTTAGMKFEPIDSDQAMLLMSQFAHTVSHPKAH